LLQGCGVGIHAEARTKIRLILSDFSDILNSLIIGGPLSRALHCNRTSAMLTLMSNRSTRVDAYIQQAPRTPAPLLAALKKNKQALKVFEGFTPAKRRDYVEWITEAKREETRGKRITTAVEWIAEGKSRNWKYEKK
jgi:hypothetical protein